MIRDSDIVCSAWKLAAAFRGGISLANLSEHQDFSTVVAAKRVTIKELEKYDSDLLTINDEEREVGYKHVFQTKITKSTTGERIRAPMGLFTRNQTYIDNDAKLLLQHLHKFYN